MMNTPVSRYAQQVARNARQRFLNPETLVQADQTPYEVIHNDGIVRLRYYPPLKESHIALGDQTIPVAAETLPVPLVLVAPLAVNMTIYDLFPNRSLVRYLRARGFQLYLVDWGKPGWEENHFDISSYYADYLPELLSRVRDHSGHEEVSLHGWSFGALFSYCAAAVDSKHIRNLALIGAPCDYHANGLIGKQYQIISHTLGWLEQRLGWKVHHTRRRFWRSPGWANALMFKVTTPLSSLQNYLDLIRNLHSEEYITNHATQGAFLNEMVAYPGGVIQDTVQYLWVENCTARGALPGAHKSTDLSSVQANTLLVYGDNDPIVTAECSLPLLDHLSSTDKTALKVPGGHMGILAGSKAPEHIWPQVADWLAERSR
ncbi:MAG: alpha/beta fold hydrolase [Halomonadaceae bacterium]|nr:MAG: alpha/beta fold hydrolase [Halomonadaceae bacterium]